MSGVRIPFPTVEKSESIYIVSHLDSSVYAQLCKFPEEILTNISTELEKRNLTGNDNPLALEDIRPGDYCVARVEDTTQRVLVKEICTPKCIVELVDYGGLHTVEQTSLQPLADDLVTKWPRVAVRIMLKEDCLVADEEERIVDDIEVIESSTVEAHLFGRLRGGTAHPENASPVKALFPKRETRTDDKQRFIIPTPEVGSIENVVVTSLNEAQGTVGVQLTRVDPDTFIAFQEKLQTVGESNASLNSKPKRGDFVLALTSHDSSWCRALVVDSGNRQRSGVMVEFVDFGNYEFVAMEDIKMLSIDVVTTPSFGILLKTDLSKFEYDSYYDVQLGPVDHTDEFSRTWIASLKETSSEMSSVAVEKATSEIATIPSHRIVVPPEKLNMTESVYVYSENAPRTYGVILNRCSASKMETCLKEIYRGSSIKQCSRVNVNDYVVVVGMEDVFSRAIVTAIDNDEVTVMCLDYGNNEKVPLAKVWPLVSGYPSDTPRMAFQCVLDVGELELIVGKEYTLNIISTSKEDGVSVVKVSTATKEGDIEVVKVTYPPLDLRNEEDLFVSDVDPENGSVIAVQLGKYELDDLLALNESLTAEIKQHPKRLKANEVSKGSLVAVPVDGGFYRGVVVEVNGDEATVFQVDFGVATTEAIGELAEMPEKFVTFPQYGFRCCLSESQLALADEEHFIATNFKKIVSAGAIHEYSFTLKKIIKDENDAEELKCQEEPQVKVVNDKDVEGFRENSATTNIYSDRNGQREMDTSTTVATVPCSETHEKTDEEIATEVSYPEFSSEAENMFVVADEGTNLALQFRRVDESQLDQLKIEMLQHYKSKSAGAVGRTVAVGDLVSFCVDNQYYRGEVSRVDEDSCHVCCIDYGTEHLSSRQLPKLLKRFAKLDRFAVRIPKTFQAQQNDYVNVILKRVNGLVTANEVKLSGMSSDGNPEEAMEETATSASKQEDHLTEFEEANDAQVENDNVGDVNDSHEVENDKKSRQENDTETSERSIPLSSKRRECSKEEDSMRGERPTECSDIASEVALSCTNAKQFQARDNSRDPSGSSNASSSSLSILSHNYKSRLSKNDLFRSNTLVNVEDREEDPSSPFILRSWFNVSVTWLYSPVKVCVVRESTKRTLTMLMDKLATLMESDNLCSVQVEDVSPGTAVIVRIDHPCVSLHRAKVLRIEGLTNLYHVYLTETGEVAQVSIESLFKLPPDISFEKVPALAIILALHADDTGVQLIHSQPHDILPMFDGILRCRISLSAADEDIPGEICYLATLFNERGDVVSQLFEEGMATLRRPRFMKNSLLLPRDGNILEFIDAYLLRVGRSPTQETFQLRATLRLEALREQAELVLSTCDKTSLKPLVTINVGSPAIVKVPVTVTGSAKDEQSGEKTAHKWTRAKVIARPSPTSYSLRLVDYGVSLVHPVRETFCCPEAALLVPEALTEVNVLLKESTSKETSNVSHKEIPNTVDSLQKLENELGKFCKQMIIARPCQQIHFGSPLPLVELFDSEGNLILN